MTLLKPTTKYSMTSLVTEELSQRMLDYLEENLFDEPLTEFWIKILDVNDRGNSYLFDNSAVSQGMLSYECWQEGKVYQFDFVTDNHITITCKSASLSIKRVYTRNLQLHLTTLATDDCSVFDLQNAFTLSKFAEELEVDHVDKYGAEF